MNKLKFIIVLFAVINLGCEKEPLETDPAKIILGKWVLVEMSGIGIEKIKPDGSYGEFLEDSIYRFYDARDKKMKYMVYYLDDSTLNVRTFIGPDGDELWERSLFKFSNRNNTLTRDISPWADAMFDVFICKRLQY
ncbi:MAG: hypothetical protein AB9846_17750 [Tenuifilaceae bacterium]